VAFDHVYVEVDSPRRERTTLAWSLLQDSEGHRQGSQVFLYNLKVGDILAIVYFTLLPFSTLDCPPTYVLLFGGLDILEIWLGETKLEIGFITYEFHVTCFEVHSYN
jgi:hypothetical protein